MSTPWLVKQNTHNPKLFLTLVIKPLLVFYFT